MKKYGSKADEELVRRLTEIRTNVQTIGQLIEDILELSHLSRNKLKLEYLNLQAIVNDVWQTLKRESPERDMTLTSGVMPVGYGDKTLMKQVYTNLLGNAVKFSKYVQHAKIETGGYDSEKETVYYVSDNGAGFDMAYCNKLFGIFHRLHPDDEFEGTGVGLAIVARIVQRHGGRVWATGEVNKGATFYFTMMKPAGSTFAPA